MSESSSHKRAKGRAAGRNEVPLKGRRRLDSASRKRATEVERSPSTARLEAAASRLKDSRRKQKVLQVPNQNMGKAAKAMKEVGVKGTVKNMGGTRRRFVSKKK